MTEKIWLAISSNFANPVVTTISDLVIYDRLEAQKFEKLVNGAVVV